MNLTAGLQTLKNMEIKVMKCASVGKSVVLIELWATLVFDSPHTANEIQ